MKKIDTNKELAHIIDYMKQAWDGFDKVDAPELLGKVWEKSLYATRHLFDEYNFIELVESLQEKFPDNKKQPLINDKVKASDLAMHILLSTLSLSRLIQNKWNYQKEVYSILSEIKKDFPEAKGLNPKGWAKLSKCYNDFAGMTEDNQSTKLFKGTNSEGSGAGSFEVRVSLPQVMYDDKGQDRKPLETLVGAMLGHAYVISQNNNTAIMVDELRSFVDNLDTSATMKFKSPLAKALASMIVSDDKPHNLEALNILEGIKRTPKP